MNLGLFPIRFVEMRIVVRLGGAQQVMEGYLIEAVTALCHNMIRL